MFFLCLVLFFITAVVLFLGDILLGGIWFLGAEPHVVFAGVRCRVSRFRRTSSSTNIACGRGRVLFGFPSLLTVARSPRADHETGRTAVHS